MKLLKFYTTWCQPCKRLSTYLDTQPLEVEIEEINVEDNQTLATQFDVMSVPVLVLLNESGEEVARNTSSDANIVQQFLKTHNLL